MDEYKKMLDIILIKINEIIVDGEQNYDIIKALDGMIQIKEEIISSGTRPMITFNNKVKYYKNDEFTIVHDCKENSHIDTLSKKKTHGIFYSMDEWRFNTENVCNIIIKYCPYCGIKLSTISNIEKEFKGVLKCLMKTN